MSATDGVEGAVDGAASDRGAADRRHVVIHYHIFKNAGTSVDQALQDAFGSAWVSVEAGSEVRDPSGHVSPEQLADFISQNPHVKAISSHTSDLPLPSLDGVEAHPIVLLRHPADRIRSIYDFARNQREDTANARLARSMDRAAFIAHGLRLGPGEGGYNVYHGFQTAVLARGSSGGTRAERARATLEQLPFVGVVDEFARSMWLLGEHLAPHFPGITLRTRRLNASGRRDDLQARLDALRAELGASLYDELIDANRSDIALWSAARERILATTPAPARRQGLLARLSARLSG